MNYWACVVMGVVATAITDMGMLVRKRWLNIVLPNYALVGRWVAYMARGIFRHRAIVAARTIEGERIVGWVVHYLTGIVFAAVLLGIFGNTWLQTPRLMPALMVGVGTVSAPFLLMQPAMGLGVAASRATNPTAARMQSLATHVLFGFGLYVAGFIARLI
ncbi:MAG: DUF2938 family protein [Steroidobacteraceae bacterium]